MQREALALLDLLDARQRDSILFPVESEERFDWHYVPRKRLGLSMKEMSSAQTEATLSLLAAFLSTRGYQLVAAIRALEPILHELEKGAGPTRDSDQYSVTLFGNPAGSHPWGLRFEGHHISLHWLLTGDTVLASTPQFFGANPAEVRIPGPQHGARALAPEEDIARALLHALPPHQLEQALLSPEAPADILTRAERNCAILEYRGVGFGELAASHQQTLSSLLDHFIDVQNAETSRRRKQSVRDSGLESLTFAWMGGMEPGEGHYYRIQSPGFLVEYDNTQNGANHIHTVWRDFGNDFGVDVLAEHYHTADHHQE